jgi:hypothetical protein
MFSIKGIFKQNTIHLLEPLNIKERTNVIITFMDEDGASTEVDDFSDTTEMDEPSGGFFSEDLDSMSPDELDEFEGIGDMEDMADLDADDLEVMSTEDDDELSEEYYSKIRKHKRYIANGNISLIEGETEIIYPLFDYSAGGLSFVSDSEFDVGISLTASIKDPIEQDMSVLDFEFEVARVVDFNGKFKIGCKFFDEVDEEIWHSLMS